ncbi:uncharacterized protein LOC135359260 [Latimeria chalumnae]|uniref:uncharacterized protein LOC135359260 n=1 Tax=Latimeria chalumnae TaxID=7897 RepID=UPI00313BC41D
MSQGVKDILLGSRKDSTRKAYKFKWKRFAIWCAGRQLDPFTCSVNSVLEYLLSLAEGGLQTSSVRMHLAAISAFHMRVSEAPLSQLRVVKRFQKGLLLARPPIKQPLAQWDINLVLSKLMEPPFEPAESVELKLLSWKILFLVAITSARRISELQALVVHEPFTHFLRDKVVLRTRPRFLPKVVSEFHINQEIFLPVFFPGPHSCEGDEHLHRLDVKHSLQIYLDRTKDIRKSDQIFVSYGQGRLGMALSKQRMSKWICDCIQLCYDLEGIPLEGHLRAHSTRCVAASVVNLQSVPVSEICRAATWSSVHTFCKHYCLDIASRRQARFGQAVLQGLFPSA